MQKFKVYWKGEFVGEFTVDELREKVARASIGSLHSVLLSSGKFVSVGDLLSKVGEFKEDEDFNLENEPEHSIAKEENFEFMLFGYALAGLSFLSIASAVGAVIYCIFLAKSGRGALASQILFLSIVIGILGYFFNHILALL